ncbi:NADH-quinone oxidoreductase subunit N 2 [uncultured delta proteobacterium]|uniref:NADH-quinone oxidoreductase subunit N n=1 Tax=uncultured delta proteobacterium TaxID=34034 RepID=A0A212JYY0_9DELT|nr:NADH-quinone oxidoreductase subunit N 2 [uncultured delta proteobacterium]
MTFLCQTAPEGVMFILVLVLFAASALGERFPSPVAKWLPIGSAIVLAVSALGLCASGSLFAGAYRVDILSQFFKLAIALGFCFVVVNTLKQPTLENAQKSDYYLFMGLSAWGLMLLASTVELVTLYLALELSSYSLYVLIPIRGRTRESAEAGAKYILFGAAATALSLYGLSHIIASQHTTYIADLMSKDWSFATNPEAVMGMGLFLCGMFYKLALFPFHFWCPDVYQGASNETAAFVATLPKLGAVIILIRLAACLKPGLELTNCLAGLALISMTFGNLCALAQKDLKRLLGFSSVAHAGYIIVGLVAGTPKGMAAAAFYALAYVIMNMLCFWVVSRVASDGRNLELKDLNGLYKRNPYLAFSLAVGAFALVGLPPTIGFMGKLFLLTAAWDHGYDWLIIGLVLNSAIAIYYYLSLVRHAYTEEDGPAVQPDNSLFSSAGAMVLATLALLFGIVPAFVFNLAVKAGEAMM